MKPKTPTLSVEPRDASIASGRRVTLTCSTLSSGAVTYTIFKNNNQIAGPISATYTLFSVATTDSGGYTCVATIAGQVSAASQSYLLNILGNCDVLFNFLTLNSTISWYVANLFSLMIHCKKQSVNIFRKYAGYILQ